MRIISLTCLALLISCATQKPTVRKQTRPRANVAMSKNASKAIDALSKLSPDLPKALKHERLSLMNEIRSIYTDDPGATPDRIAYWVDYALWSASADNYPTAFNGARTYDWFGCAAAAKATNNPTIAAECQEMQNSPRLDDDPTRKTKEVARRKILNNSSGASARRAVRTFEIAYTGFSTVFVQPHPYKSRFMTTCRQMKVESAACRRGWSDLIRELRASKGRP